MTSTPDTTKVNWYAAYTRPNFEMKVRRELIRRDLVHYLPVRKVSRQWSDRMKKLEVPLFPNYIFVHSTANQRNEALSIKGMMRYVLTEGQPTIIPDTVIDWIHKLEAEELHIEDKFTEGDRVRVIQGPFEGLEGILFKKKGSSRFGIHIPCIRQCLSLEIDPGLLRRIKA